MSFGRLSDCEAGRKRRRGSDEETPESSDVEGVARAPRKMSTALRGRGPGRPPSHGKYVGLAQAKKELEEAQRAAEEADRAAQKATQDRKMEKKVAEWTRNNVRSSRLFSVSSSDVDMTDHGTDIEEDVAVIKMIATKSGNLKGNFVRALKNAATSISDKYHKAATKNTSEEEAKLRAENAQLRTAMDILRKEFDQVRAELSRLTEAVSRTNREEAMVSTPTRKSGPPSDDESLHKFAIMVGNMIDAKVAALEPRLLPAQRERPPLAADTRRRQSTEAIVMTEASPAPPKKTGPAEKKATKKKATKKDRERRKTPPPPPPVVPPPAVTSGGPSAVPSSLQEGWSAVVKRGGKGNPRSAQQTQSVQRRAAPPAAKTSGRTKKRRIRGPKTSAIVLALRPEAAMRGLTYKEVLVKMKTSIPLSSVGITGGVKIKEIA